MGPATGPGSGAPKGKPAPVPPSLFLAASDDQRDVDRQKATSDRFEKFIGKMCAAICSAWSQWQSAAALVNVRIDSAFASGGKVVGPPMYALTLAQAPLEDAWSLKRTEAIAGAVDQAFRQFQDMVAVPGLAWYPAFVAFPAPVAPPMPNVPFPLMALNGARSFATTPVLKQMMLAKFGAPEDYAEELFDAIATGVTACFATWVTCTMVTKVMGTGPIPTFAPPYVPVGPVVGGTGTMVPGGFV